LSVLLSSGKTMRPNMLGPLDKSWFEDKYCISKWRSLLFLWTYLLTYVEHLFKKLYINASVLKQSSEKFRYLLETYSVIR